MEPLLLAILALVALINYILVPLPPQKDLVWHIRQYRRRRQISYTPRHAAHV